LRDAGVRLGLCGHRSIKEAAFELILGDRTPRTRKPPTHKPPLDRGPITAYRDHDASARHRTALPWHSGKRQREVNIQVRDVMFWGGSAVTGRVVGCVSGFW
jgi:hypothetical protein